MQNDAPSSAYVAAPLLLTKFVIEYVVWCAMWLKMQKLSPDDNYLPWLSGVIHLTRSQTKKTLNTSREIVCLNG